MSWVLVTCFWALTIGFAWDHISRAGERLGWKMHGRGMRLLREREEAARWYQQLMALRPHDRELLAWHGGHTWRYTDPREAVLLTKAGYDAAMHEKAQERTAATGWGESGYLEPDDELARSWVDGHGPVTVYRKPGSRYHGDDPPPEVR